MSVQNQDNDEVLTGKNAEQETMEQEKLEDSHAAEEKLESPQKSADSLEEQLELAQQKASGNWDLYVRAKAEIDTLRRRNSKDVENAHKYGIEKFVTELLPVLDSMGMGLAVEDASADSLREGMELTMNMLKKMMDNLGIEEVDPMNQKFDPEKHQVEQTEYGGEHEQAHQLVTAGARKCPHVVFTHRPAPGRPSP